MYYDYQIAGVSVLCLMAVPSFLSVADHIGVIRLTKLD